FGCPDCGGTLWEMQDGGLLRYRCRVGHAWSAEHLLARKSEALEAALWTALRALEEQAALARRLGARAASRGFPQAAEVFGRHEADARTHAETLRGVLLRHGPVQVPGAGP